MKVLFALPGLHRTDRGAEIAFISVANELAKNGDTVTLIGSGLERPDSSYRFLHARSLGRENFESFPSLPTLRNDCAYEELTFLPHLLRQYRPSEYDVTITCGYPFTNWALRRPTLGGQRPPHVFVTQNGDWPAYANNSEYRFFGCEGLICINPDMYERNKSRWRCQLIPNGVDLSRFRAGAPSRQQFGLPIDQQIVLIVSALIPSKRVEAGVEIVHRIPNAHLLLAGDGPLRKTIDDAAERLLPGRYTRVTVTPDVMPALYQSADVFLHLSKEEAFGNVYLEAMACGLPVVAHESPRTRWIVGEDERLFGTDDPEAIAQLVKAALDSAHGNIEGRIKKAAAFSWQKISGMYRSFLKEVVTARH